MTQKNLEHGFRIKKEKRKSGFNKKKKK